MTAMSDTPPCGGALRLERRGQLAELSGAPAHAFHLPEHPFGIGELPQQPVDLLDGGAAAACDSASAAAVDDLGVPAFGRGHRPDHGLEPAERAFVELAGGGK